MALHVITDTGQQDVVVVNARLWLTADKSAVVPDGDPAAAFLLCPAGGTIERTEAERLGLVAVAPVAAAIDYGGLTLVELRELAVARGIETRGVKKADLAAALIADDVGGDG